MSDGGREERRVELVLTFALSHRSLSQLISSGTLSTPTSELVNSVSSFERSFDSVRLWERESGLVSWLEVRSHLPLLPPSNPFLTSLPLSLLWQTSTPNPPNPTTPFSSPLPPPHLLSLPPNSPTSSTQPKSTNPPNTSVPTSLPRLKASPNSCLLIPSLPVLLPPKKTTTTKETVTTTREGRTEARS